MKRYKAQPNEIRGDDHYELPGDEVYYSRADLIAAGVLVPVPDGEVCELDDAGSEAVVYYDSVTDSNYIILRTGCGTFLLTGEKIDLGKDASVKPVRLVKLEDVG